MVATHTMSLSPDVVEGLRDLSQGASDFLGRSVGVSAVIRALVRRARRQGSPAAYELFLEIEKELNAGVRWGGKKQ